MARLVRSRLLKLNLTTPVTGTGKTLLARAVAHHTECTFIRVSGSELVQKYIGEGARMVRELFVMARYALV
jgi:ATP-dependent 26S proteasome regulatory subunit